MQRMGCLGALKVMGNATIRLSAYDFLFDFNRNYVSIFYHFRDIAGYLWKVADFDPPHLHSAPPQGVTPVEFRGDLWHQKTRLAGLSCGVVFVILRLAVLVELQLATDRQKDGRTQGHGQYRGCIASRGKNAATRSRWQTTKECLCPGVHVHCAQVHTGGWTARKHNRWRHKNSQTIKSFINDRVDKYPLTKIESGLQSYHMMKHYETNGRISCKGNGSYTFKSWQRCLLVCVYMCAWRLRKDIAYSSQHC